MMFSKNTFIVFFFFSLLLCIIPRGINKLYAQGHQLKTVEIKHKVASTSNEDIKLKGFSEGMKWFRLDTTLIEQYALNNLQQLLEQQVPVFIKNYGINSMASMHFRGASAAQSQVFWNGIPLNSASSGSTDVSSINVATFDQLHVVYGSSAALLGSANVGAALLLDNNFEIDTLGLKKWKHQVAFELGSYGKRNGSIRERYTWKRGMLELKYLNQYADNQFEVSDPNGKQFKLKNAQWKNNTLLLNTALVLPNQWYFKMGLWLQQYQRQIPAALFESSSLKAQKDNTLRSFISFEKRYTTQTIFYTKTAYTQDNMEYSDPAIAMFTDNKVHTLYQEMGLKFEKKPNQKFLIFSPSSLSWTTTSKTFYQSKIALAASHSIRFGRANRWHLASQARVERINRLNVALAGLNLKYQLFQNFSVKANVQRCFRAPTLNELYFEPGGNPNLKPEKGWNYDGSLLWHKTFYNTLNVQAEWSAFARTIDNWILWFGGSIWTPHNIAKVYSRGFEMQYHLDYQWRKIKYTGSFNALWVRATTEASDIPNDNSIGKQIPYTPPLQYQAHLGLEWQHWSFNLSHNYVAYRFTTTDESQFIKAYALMHFTCTKQFLFGEDKELLSSFQIQNVMNHNYQVVYGRPMMGRNFNFSVKLNF